MTVAAAPVAVPARGHGLTWRPVVRLAARQARACKGASILVILLIAAPFLAATASLCLRQSLNPSRAEQLRMEFGAGDVRVYGMLDAAAVAALPAGTRLATFSRANSLLGGGAGASSVTVLAAGGDLDLARSRYVLRSGAWPVNDGEIALTGAAVKALHARPGGAVTAGGRAMRLVGTYDSLRNRQAKEGLTVRGGGAASPVSETLIDVPAGLDPGSAAATVRATTGAALTQADAGPRTGGADQATVLAQWSVIFVQIMLMIGALFMVIREREASQARALDLVGARRAQIVAVAVLRALALAAVAIVAGGGLGIAVAELIRRSLRDTQPFVTDTLRLPAASLGLLVALVLATTAVSAMVALRPAAGGWAPVRRARRLAITTALLVGGLAGTVLLRAPEPGPTRVVLISASCTAAAIGAALLGAQLLFLGAARARGPAVVRIAMRDLRGHRAAVTGLMVAAVTGLVGAVMAVCALSSLAQRDEHRYQPALARDQIVLNGASSARADGVARAVGGATVAPMRPALRSDALVLALLDGGGQTTVVIAGPADLPAYGIRADAAGEANEAFVLVDGPASGGRVRLAAPGWQRSLPVSPARPARPAWRSDSPLPAVVLSDATAAALGLSAAATEPSSWVLHAARPLTAHDRAEVDRFTSSDPGVTAIVETGWSDSNAALRRTVSVGLILFGALSCLLLVMLAEAERARTYAVLRLIGCGPLLRRGLPLVTAATLAGWLVVLSTGVGLGLIAAVLRGTRLSVDWRVLTANALLVVVLAAAGAMIVSLRRKEVAET